jgi:hypothetical protein
MPSPAAGLYEALVTVALKSALEGLDHGLEAQKGPLRSAEAADRIALHLARLITRAVEAIEEKDRLRRA